MTSTGRRSVLVCGSRPEVGRDRVVVSPASAVTFDGDRWRFLVRVREAIDGETQSREVEGLATARRVAIRSIESATPPVVVFESPPFFREALPGDPGRDLEARLRAAAFSEGATFLAWQSEPASAHDRRRYEVIVDRATGSAGPAGRPEIR